MFSRVMQHVWPCNFTFTEYQSGCEEVLHEPSGFISSPDEDNDGQYEINQECHWTLWALGGGQVIYFEFLEFDLEDSYLCVWDFVEIKEVCFCAIQSPFRNM